MDRLDIIKTQFETLIQQVRDAHGQVDQGIHAIPSDALQRDAAQLIQMVRTLPSKDAHQIKNFISTLIEELDKLAETLRHKGKNI